MEPESCNENFNKYLCVICDYVTSRKSSLDKHFSTAKHIQCANGGATCDTNGDANIHGKVANIHKPKQDKIYSCDKCSKIYNSRNGLWKHKQQLCVEETKPNDTPDQNIISFLMKQNQDFKDLMMEQNKMIIDVMKNHMITNNTINNTVNSNNKTFNLNLFLHEECKDAMNINEFLDSINFQLSDLEHMGRVGYVEGIAKLIITNLNALDVTKRPLHCTDPKRETIYIKDGDVWIKEDADNKNVRKLIKRVAFRNSKSIRLYKEKYPEYRNPDSRYSDTYNKIVLEAMGGGSKCDDYDSENKIIRKLTKVITIDKSQFT